MASDAPSNAPSSELPINGPPNGPPGPPPGPPPNLGPYKYSREQLDKYYEHIGITREDAPSDSQVDIDAWRLKRLTRIQLHHMQRVPFESLSLHYSKTRTLSLDPEDLFDKIVNKGRGGYCMEVNQFFATIMRTEGFDVMSVGGRVLLGKMGGWNHQLNIVTIGDQNYVVDVGFGSGCPVEPIPLQDGIEVTLVAPSRGKLEYKTLPVHSNPNQKVWVYSVQVAPQAPWVEQYCFVEVEFFPADFEVMNIMTMSSPKSFFVQNVLAVRIVVGGTDSEPKAESTLTLFRDYLKITTAGKTEHLETFKTDEERIAALNKWFDISISLPERFAIIGLPSELKGYVLNYQ